MYYGVISLSLWLSLWVNMLWMHKKRTAIRYNPNDIAINP